MRTTPSRTPRLLGALLAAALLAGCTDAASPTPSPDVPATPTETSAPVAVLAVDWTDPDLEVPLAEGWVLRDCEGDAPLLCVHDGATVLGIIEAGGRPVDPELADVIAEQGLEAGLRSHVDGYHEAFTADRAHGCDDYRYEAHPTELVTLAGVPALRYGFSGHSSAGVEVERNVNYVTVIGDELRTITAVANTEESCVYTDVVTELVPEELVAIQGSLDAVAAGSQLPPA